MEVSLKSGRKKEFYEQLKFEIRFFEALIKDKPDFIDALIHLGEAYTKVGLYKKGLKIDKKLTKLKPTDPIVHYNLACSYSLLGMVDKAFKAIDKAIRLGWHDWRHMELDPDLKNLRQDVRFGELISKYKLRASKEAHKRESK
jgi:tetratricopeptide (TPR) repeat protein